jgi:hypothetical protein
MMRVVARHISNLKYSIARTPLSAVPRVSIVSAHSTASHYKTLRPNKSFVKTHVVNMSSESTQSQACCNTPAVVTKGYSPKGDYIEVDGLKTCSSHLLNPRHTIADLLSQTPRAPKTQNKVSSSSTTSSASSTKPSKAPTS